MSWLDQRLGGARKASLRPPGVFQLAVGLLAAYVGTAVVGRELGLGHPAAIPVWAPAGLALAALLAVGYGASPAIALGAFLANATATGSLPTALGVASGHTLAALAGAYLVKRYAHGRRAFDDVRDTFRFIALAGVSFPLISATVGAISLRWGGIAPGADWGAVWRTWWLGDAAGVVVITPLVLLWADNPSVANLRPRALEAGGLLVAAALVGRLGCGVLPATPDPLAPLLLLAIPVVAWASFRFGQRELLTVVAVLSTFLRAGCGSGGALGTAESALPVQAALAMLAGALLPVPTLVRGRSRPRDVLSPAEQGAAVDRTRAEFVDAMAHELQTPLTNRGLAMGEAPPILAA